MVVSTDVVKVSFPNGVAKARERDEYLPEEEISARQFSRDVLMAREVHGHLAEAAKPTLEWLERSDGRRIEVEYFRLEWVAVLCEMATYKRYRLRPRLFVKLSLIGCGRKEPKVQEIQLLVCPEEPIPDDFMGLSYEAVADMMLKQLRSQLLRESRSIAGRAKDEAQAKQDVWGQLEVGLTQHGAAPAGQEA